MTLQRTTPLLGVLVLAVSACGYSAGSISYAQHPELKTVRLYSGHPDPEGEDLGVVEVIREGSRDCSKLGTEALLQLLAEAKALGGTGVKDVKFRGRYHWMGRVVCRGSISSSSVQARGIATR